ncbi:autotransporter domain-containing protein [Pseudomonas purpurea]|uniref:autotransporter family protein n=1 Tax=Pseudomonas purpurea TaxID=3136737 RepID=UPI003267EBC2
MTPALFRKTLLSLAIATTASTALPVCAQTLQLTDAGLSSVLQTYTDTVEVNGTFTSANSDLDAVAFNGSTFQKDLILNATIDANGNFADGVDMDQADSNGQLNTVAGNLINKGSISAIGGGATALLIDPVVVGGNVINEGSLIAKGEPIQDGKDLDVARALEVSGSSVISGDLVNAATGKIIAEGTGAKGILLMGGEIKGKVINNGLIQVTGKDATALDMTSNEKSNYNNLAKIGGFENHGTIIAKGDDASGLKIDGAYFTGDTPQIINTGVIQADDAAIAINGFQSERITLNIVNSGTIISKDEAIDASDVRAQIYLTMKDGSKITGNLIGLDGATVYGHAVFNGTDATVDGANIKMLDGRGWVDVGLDINEGMPVEVGHLELGQPHTSLIGSIGFTEGSSLDLNLSRATDPNKAVLSVSEIAQFDHGSQIRLAAQGQDFNPKGVSYKLVQAGRVTDEGLSVVSTSALLNVDTFTVRDSQIFAKVTGKGEAEVNEIIVNHGANRNTQQALSSFSRDAIMSKLKGDDAVFQAFANASEAQLAELAKQLTPDVDGGATQAATTSQTLISNVTGNRTAGVRGQSSGEAFKDTGVWVQSLYSDATQDLRDGVAGYNAYSRGVAVGADGKLNENVTLGLAYSFLNTDVNGKTGNKTAVDSQAFTLYGGFEQGNYFVDGSLTYGKNDNESKRRIAGTTAKGDYDSNLLGLNLAGGYTYHLNDEVLIEPRVAARYTMVDIDGYREKGSSAALKIDDQRYEALELGAGLRVAGHYPLGQGTLVPQAKLMAYHDFAADKASSTSTFVVGDTPFITSGAKAARNSYEAGVGTDYRLGAVTLGLNYDYVGKSGFDADTFTAKVRYDF